MDVLTTMKSLLGLVDNSQDAVCQFYLDNAKDIICGLRNTDKVEPQYITTQVKIAIELYSKQGAEGQTSHSENGITRMYEKANVSPSLLNEITPFVRTPFSTVRTVV